MLLSVVTLALLGASPCNLSLLAPAVPPARPQAAAPALLLQEGCGEGFAEAHASRPRWQRRTVTFLGSAAGAAVGTLAGGLVGYALSGDCGDSCWFGPPEMWLGAAIGFPLGAGAGAHLSGDAMGGEGRWWSTLLGTAAGTALTMLLWSIAASDESAAPILYAAPLLPSVGALVGYELGQRPAAPPPGCAREHAALSSRRPLLSLRLAF
ncbi:MAG TPA: hypothetical protein VFO83_09125 [Aggregicoccus sp.]|nr:hypothetical protein [Aggregicoccus sp.]